MRNTKYACPPLAGNTLVSPGGKYEIRISKTKFRSICGWIRKFAVSCSTPQKKEFIILTESGGLSGLFLLIQHKLNRQISFLK